MIVIGLAIALAVLTAAASAQTRLNIEKLWLSSPGYVAVAVNGLPGGLVRFRCSVRDDKGNVLGEEVSYGSGVTARNLVGVPLGSAAGAISAECWLDK